jgi:hypothetical protein
MSISMPAVDAADSPERIPGAAFRAAASLHLTRSPHLSREALARELRERLERRGIGYHLRTLKRQLSGSVATVPPEVERALLREAGLGSDEARTPTYMARERVLPLAELWLYLHPDRSKRALADLGRRLGVSRERVRQLEERTKSKLRLAFEAAAQRSHDDALLPPDEDTLAALCA